MNLLSFSSVSRRWRGAMVILLLIAMLLAAYGLRAAPWRATPFDLPGADPRLVALRSARVIAISEYAGSSFGAATTGVNHTLTWRGDEFVGDGRFQVTGYAMAGGGVPVLTKTATQRATLPKAATITFLQQLATLPPLQGSYTPPAQPSHSNHSIKITVETDEGDVEFSINPYPASTPLTSITHAGVKWQSISSQVLEALAELEKYLLRLATLDGLVRSSSSDVYATQQAKPTPTPVPPMICRTVPSATRVPAVATPSAPAPRALSPGDPVRTGDTINLAVYFGLPQPPTRQISLNPDSASAYEDLTIRDPRRIAALNAALDRPATVVAYPPATTGRGTILLVVDLFGKSLGLGYFALDDLIAFSIGGKSYAIVAPPGFRAVLVEQLCHK